MALDTELTSMGFEGFRHHASKHLVKPMYPDGGPSQLIGGKNVYHHHYMLRTMPGLEKLTNSDGSEVQLGSAGYRRVTGIFPFILASGAVYFVITTPRDVYSYAPGGDFTSIKGALSLTATETDYADATYWTDTSSGYDPWLLITNGVDAPFYWDGTGNCAALANAPALCKRIGSFANHVMAMYVNSYQQRDQWSNVDDATDWSGGTAGVNDLRENPGRIQGHLKFGDYRYVIKEDTLARCIATGYDPPFRFDESFVNVGTIAPRTIIKPYRYDYGFFLGSDMDVYLLSKDGHYIPIGDDIAYQIREWANDQTLKYAFAYYYPFIDHIFIAMPSFGNTDNYCDVQFGFDMGHYMRTGQKVWTPPIYNGLYISAAAHGKFRRYPTIGEMTGTIGGLEATLKIGELYEDAAFNQVILGDKDGYVWKYDERLDTVDGTEIDWTIELMDYKFSQNPMQNFRLQEYALMFNQKANESGTIYVSTNGGYSYGTYDTISFEGSAATDEELYGYAYPDILANKHRVKISGSGFAEIIGQKFWGTQESRF